MLWQPWETNADTRVEALLGSGRATPSFMVLAMLLAHKSVIDQVTLHGSSSVVFMSISPLDRVSLGSASVTFISVSPEKGKVENMWWVFTKYGQMQSNDQSIICLSTCSLSLEEEEPGQNLRVARVSSHSVHSLRTHGSSFLLSADFPCHSRQTSHLYLLL